jgi:hypothetical protein
MVVEKVGGGQTHWLAGQVASPVGHHLATNCLGQVGGAPPWPYKYPPIGLSGALLVALARKLCQNPMDSDRESLLESLRCIGIPACRDSHDITLEWMICQSE